MGQPFCTRRPNAGKDCRRRRRSRSHRPQLSRDDERETSVRARCIHLFLDETCQLATSSSSKTGACAVKKTLTGIHIDDYCKILSLSQHGATREPCYRTHSATKPTIWYGSLSNFSDSRNVASVHWLHALVFLGTLQKLLAVS
jgi:hypothetical protein